jgi:hypothetical protein
MTILDDMLQQIKNSDLDEQLKQVCDEIMKEERPKFKNPVYEPRGSNIFLAVEYEDGNNISYLCLEREFKEIYILTIWSKSKSSMYIKKKSSKDINEITIQKILETFAKKLKYLRGE